MTDIKLSNHYWERDEDVYSFVRSLARGKSLVVDVGCGQKYFDEATELIDYIPLNTDKKVHQLDVSWDKLPYEDKEVDFLYCRHTIEDIPNPRWLISEINRVAKAGYVECPSPLIEIARGADAGSPPWRGYYHHRSVVWSDGDKLTIVPKYPIIEHFQFPDKFIIDLLQKGKDLWNTYHLWKDELKVDFSFGSGNPHSYDIIQDYGNILMSGVQMTIGQTQKFLNEIRS